MSWDGGIESKINKYNKQEKLENGHKTLGMKLCSFYFRLRCQNIDKIIGFKYRKNKRKDDVNG